MGEPWRETPAPWRNCSCGHREYGPRGTSAREPCARRSWGRETLSRSSSQPRTTLQSDLSRIEIVHFYAAGPRFSKESCHVLLKMQSRDDVVTLCECELSTQECRRVQKIALQRLRPPTAAQIDYSLGAG